MFFFITNTFIKSFLECYMMSFKRFLIFLWFITTNETFIHIYIIIIIRLFINNKLIIKQIIINLI